jgi:integrase
MQVSTANNSLCVLRRILDLATEWSVLTIAPKVKVLSGERRREPVITLEEEARYLAAAPKPLASIAAVQSDTGTRHEECFPLRSENVTWLNGRNGALLGMHGKAAAARTVIPMTPRVRSVLELQREEAGKAEDGWVWPAPTRGGHVEPSSLRKQHAKTLSIIAVVASKRDAKPVRPFVLNSPRHTFPTRLGESGCDVWTLARIAGHASINISARYVHPSEGAVFSAISRLGRQNWHTQNDAPQLPVAKDVTSAVN